MSGYYLQQIDHIEQQVDEMLALLSTLQSENRALKRQLSKTMLEYAELQQKHMQNAERIRLLIKRLKSSSV